MLKWLAVVAMVISVAQASMPTCGQAPNDNRDKGYAAKSDSRTSQTNSADPKMVPQPPQASQPQDESRAARQDNNQQSVTITEAASMPNKRDWVDYTTLLIGIIIAVITGAGVIAAWRGLPEFKRQAEAAVLNAQAVISAERAWIVIEVERESKTIFHFRAKNTGRTAAHIKAIYGYPLLVRRNREAPVPDFTKSESLLSTPPCLLPAQATCSSLRCNIEDLRGNDTVEDFLKYVDKGLFEIWFYGRILYFNTVEPEPRTERETKWFFWYVPFQDALPIPDPRHPEWNTYS